MADLKSLLKGKLEYGVSLAQFTTIGIGGPARYLVKANSTADLIDSVKSAIATKTPYFLLGNGSNTLISDSGFDGLVIINNTNKIEILPDPVTEISHGLIKSRLEQPHSSEFFTMEGLAYNEEDDPPVGVVIDSGTRLQAAIYKLISQGITGLQWFAGIPGTIGGAIYLNSHGGPKFISDFFQKASLITKDGEIKTKDSSYFKFDYDYSTLCDTHEIVVQATFVLKKGNKEKALRVAQEWSKRKSLQPQRTLGSTFQNISHEQMEKLGFRTTSTGYIIDKILGLKGVLRVGDAIVSPRSANFIENLGEARASDVYQIIMTIKKEAKQKIGIDLTEEIKYLGDFKK